MLPEPGQVVAIAAAGNADDLIAQMAEAQIDQMLSAADVSPPDSEPVAEPESAIDVSTSQQLEPKVSAAIPDLIETDAVTPGVIGEPPTDLIKDVDRVADAVAAVSAALDAVDAPSVNAAEASMLAEPIVIPPSAAAIMPTAERAVEAPASDAHAVDSADAVAAELAADALLHGRSLEPSPSTHALEPALVKPPAHIELPAHVTPVEQAAAVAAAADHAEHASSIPEVPASSPLDAKVSTWMTTIREIPWFVLDAINAPVRSLSDPQREALGGIAIVTIVNAAGLLIYRIFFAKH